MKRLSVIFLVVVCCLVFTRSAYADDEYRHGGYGEVVWKLGLVNDKAGLFVGGKGAWLINHQVSLGGGSFKLFDVEMDEISPDGKPLYLDMFYGGVELGYVFNYKKKTNWTIHTLLGGGEVRLLEHDPEYVVESDRFFVVEPRVGVDMAVARWFHIGLSASYFFAVGVDLDLLTSADISGPSGMLSFKFGWF